jgi:hypothetical protein
MTTKISADNIQASTLENLGGSPTITGVEICDSSYVTLDDTAVALTGGYIRVLGTRFTTGCQVLVDQVPATAVTFVSATELRVQVPALNAGTYIVYVVNTDGSTAIRINGLTASATPSWVTGSTLPEGASGTAISIQLVASSATTYTLASGSSLPEGLTLSSGGLLSGTITTSTETTYNFSVVATDLELQDSPRSFSVNITVGDAQIAYVTALLSPQVTQSFVADSSTNNFPVTVVGDTRPNNYNPYTPGYYSFNFTAKTQYVSVPATTALTTYTGDFTFEAWIHPTDTAISYWSIWDSRQNGATAQPMVMGLEPLASPVTGQGRLTYFNGSKYQGTGIVLYNRWTHIAFVRSGSTLTFYVDGVAGGTATLSGTQTGTATTNPIWIGTKDNSSAGYGTTGFISNLRVVNGTAVYTSNFTPSTEPLTAITNTVLLTAQSNRFLDNSTNNYTLTPSSATISGFDPFLPSSAHTGRGSGYFDGTGDYLTVSSTAFDISAATSWTVECWIYPTLASTTQYLWQNYTTSGSTIYGQALMLETNAVRFEVWQGSSASTQFVLTSAAININQWTHIAVVRNGSGTNNNLLFINGVLAAQGSWTTHAAPGSALTYIGARNYNSIQNPFRGHIADLRVTKGTALYTTAFAPPTQSLTAISGTSLLTLQSNQPHNNNCFLDSSSNNLLVTRAGNATQGAFSPYGGGWSNYFDGTGDYLTAPANAQFQFTGDFTIEGWMNFNSIAGSPQALFSVKSGTNEFDIRWYATRWQISLNAGSGTDIGTTPAPVNGVWTHVAAVRSGSSIKLYVNGVQTGTTLTNSSTLGHATSAAGIGASNSGSNNFTGYISNVRVVNGTALYTANFTPPVAPLQPVAKTALLTCADNRFVDDSTNNFTITRNGDVRVEKFNPFGVVTANAPLSYSAYFDGNGDSVTTPSSSALAFGTGDFTVEFWLNFNSTSNRQDIIWWGLDSNDRGGITWNLTAGNLTYYISPTVANAINYAITPVVGTWYHIALVRASGSTKLYVNGTQAGTTYSDTKNYASSSYLVTVGKDSGAASSYLNGYISNLRIVKGTAVYTTNFTPPITALTAVSGTSLLACQSDKFVDAGTNNIAITATGNVQPSQTNPFGFSSGAKTSYTPAIYGGSVRFDGTGDYLDLPNNAVFGQTGSWTLETWVYLTGSTNNYLYSQVTSNFLQLNISATNTVLVDRSGVGTLITSSSPIPLNTWTHIAVVSDGTNIKLFVNGVQSGSTAAVGTQALSAATTRIGAYQSNGTLAYPGFISDMRLVKGTAVYTGNFVPPITPLQPVAGTVLLLNGTSSAVYDSSTTNNLETVGDVRLNTSVVKYGNTSISFDGTGDYLSVSSSAVNQSTAFGTGNFTVEFWFNATSNSGTQQLFDTRPAGTTSTAQYIALTYLSGSLNYYTAGAAPAIAGGTVTPGVWNHVALTRSGTSTRLFINGTQAGSTFTDSQNYLGSVNRPILATDGNTPNTANFTGSISDLRITKGVARYTANFTPPVSALKTK